MTFIKLSNLVINTAKISSIRIHKNHYDIYVSHSDVCGWMFHFPIFGMGEISSNNTRFNVSKEEHETDYEIISNWINNHTKSVF